MLNAKIDLQWFADAKTLVSDIIIPELYDAYTYEETKKLSAFYQGGIIQQDARLDELCGGGGQTVVIPYFNDLTGDDEVFSDTGATTLHKITTGKQVAIRIIRTYGIEVADLAGILAGADPMGDLFARITRYWVRAEQSMLIAEINGLFGTGGALATTHMNDVSAVAGGGVIDAETVLNTKQLLGDAAGQLVAVAMHSAVYTKLQTDNVINDVVFTGPSGSQITIPTYLGYRVIVDDSMPVTDGVYTTVFFANGTIARGTKNPDNLKSLESDRDITAHSDVVVTNRAIVLHPIGTAWTGSTMADYTPTNAELATPANWTKVFEDKAIGIVALKHKLVANAA